MILNGMLRLFYSYWLGSWSRSCCKLNQELFETAPDDLPIFDDISGMFRLEFNRIGSTALELLLEENRSFGTADSDTGREVCSVQLHETVCLRSRFTRVLDYQKFNR